MSLLFSSLSRIIGKGTSCLTVYPKCRCVFIKKMLVNNARQQFKQTKHFSTSLVCKQMSQAQEGTNKMLKIWVPAGVLAIGAVAYGTYIYDSSPSITRPASSLMDSSAELKLIEPPPEPPVARSIHSPADKTGLKITLYQYQTCPFCCKVRAFLDYFGFSYDVVEVNSVTRKETKWTAYRKVPFLVVEQPDSETILQLKDSSMIISVLQSFLLNKTQTLEEIVSYYPTEHYFDEDQKEKIRIHNRYFLMYGQKPKEIAEDEILHDKKWRKWIDDVYVHTLSPNIYRTMDESLQSFQYFSKVGNWEEHFSTWERILAVYVGSVAMYFIGKRLKKRYGLKDDVRQTLYEETNKWTKEIRKNGGKFMGGAEPSLSDLGFYGILSAIEGCDAFEDLLRNTKIKPWYTNMKGLVDSRAGAKYIEQRGKCTVTS